MTSIKKIEFTAFLFSILIGFAACKNNDAAETRNIQLLKDTSAFHNNISSDTSKTTQTRLIQRHEKEHNHVYPEGTNPVNSGSSNSANTGSANSGNTGSANSGTSSSGNASSNANSGTVSNGTSTHTQATHKQGWSKGAQDAVIGGVGGAIGGAIISKKKGTGAAVGGVIGAAGGYILGHEKDKKDGRVK
ncbi:MAG: glycine zipper domain-containing protein [Bacteroidota bacterium]|nr:glycine zipper domain-containing protein [Bacteroidota bacterium]